MNPEERLQQILDRMSAIRDELREAETAEQRHGDDADANPLPEGHAERVAALADEFDKLDEERTPLQTEVERRQRIRNFASNPANRESGDGAREGAPAPTRNRDPYDVADLRVVNQPVDQIRSRAFRAIEQDRYLTDDERHQVTRLIERTDSDGRLSRHILATGHPAYRTAWAKMMAGADNALTERERQAIEDVRAQSLTTTQGGFAVPFTLDPTLLLTSDGRINPLRQIARTVQITTDQWNGISTSGVSAAYGAEAVQVGDSTATIAQPSIDVEKGHVWVAASIEITQDWSNLASELVRLFGDAKDDLEASKFTLGHGSASTEPGGVVYQVGAVTASRVAATTTSAYGLVDVYNTQQALPPRYRPNASWMANLNYINRTRQFGTANNYHGFLTDLAGDSPGQLLGKPWYEASHMASALTTGADVLLYGDFSRFYIVDRIGMSVEFVPHVFGANNRPTGQRGWYCYWRNGSGVVDANAFAQLRLTS